MNSGCCFPHDLHSFCIFSLGLSKNTASIFCSPLFNTTDSYRNVINWIFYSCSWAAAVLLLSNIINHEFCDWIFMIMYTFISLWYIFTWRYIKNPLSLWLSIYLTVCFVLFANDFVVGFSVLSLRWSSARWQAHVGHTLTNHPGMLLDK